MTSKSPARSAEDVDETALSYAEIKALCTGNPHIKEKMDLDIEVQRLKLLKGAHLSQKYALEDQILKELPQKIASYEQRITGYAADMECLARNTQPNKDDFSPMEIEETVYTEKKAAGSAILAACQAGGDLEELATEYDVGYYGSEDMTSSSGMASEWLFDSARKAGDMELLEEPIRAVRDYDPDVVVGIGGGASMDAAKALLVFLEHPDMTWERAVSQDGVGPFSGRRTLIAVPTTSGTGAEATKTSVVVNNYNGLKKSLYHTTMIADIVILDPTLTVSLPEKITVFGVGKKTQDIYNADTLNRMLSYAVITRTFAEITGKEIRRIHQVPVSFSSVEREVYRKAVEEFFALRQQYFALTGNSRKDSMMALIQQITLLLRISAAPNTVEEYDITDLPVKLKKVCDMVAEWNDEVVVIGVRHKNVVEAYAEAIRQRFPERKLFTVTGSTTTLAGRRKLKKSLKESGNGIMVCTQQCLPSSVNFEFVNKVVIPELHYNNARMSQFYMRFVRFTSTDWKDIYFVTYSGSIESNQMQMVLAKERLNLFMRGQNASMDEIYEKFGVNYDLLSLLMSREEDDEGHFQIRWGQQFIDNDG